MKNTKGRIPVTSQKIQNHCSYSPTLTKSLFLQSIPSKAVCQMLMTLCTGSQVVISTTVGFRSKLTLISRLLLTVAP